MIFEVFVRDLVFTALHPTANRDAGFVNRIGIARNERVPPIEVATLCHQAVGAT
jgi:hypothetical protein